MNKTEKQHFIDACFADNLDDFYEDWIAEKKDRIQFFTVRDIDSWKKRITALSDIDKKMFSKDVISFKHLPPVFNHHYWMPSSRCISSGEELTRENIDIHITYWQPHLWKPIRKDLKQEYRKKEAYKCQLLDRNCNDCAHLERGKINMCGLKNEKIDLSPVTSQNNNCFKHRLEV